MELMLHVTSADSAPLLLPLARACGRAGVAWGCFFTNDGVRALADQAIVAALASAAKAQVCEHSWTHHMGTGTAPVELASQTANSAMMAEAKRVVSL